MCNLTQYSLRERWAGEKCLDKREEGPAFQDKLLLPSTEKSKETKTSCICSLGVGGRRAWTGFCGCAAILSCI